jgi:autotransporter-associated beta strand protein
MHAVCGKCVRSSAECCHVGIFQIGAIKMRLSFFTRLGTGFAKMSEVFRVFGWTGSALLDLIAYISPKYLHESRIRFVDMRVGFLREGGGWHRLDHRLYRWCSDGRIIDLPAGACPRRSFCIGDHYHSCASTVHGGQARFITNAGGSVDISGLTSGGMTAGSIEGAGTYALGSNALTVGLNNLSTLVSGSISDGGLSGGTGGALVKVGTGTLTLTGPNTYSGGTSFNGGIVAVNSDANLGTGRLSFNGGTLQALASGGE